MKLGYAKMGTCSYLLLLVHLKTPYACDVVKPLCIIGTRNQTLQG